MANRETVDLRGKVASDLESVIVSSVPGNE